MTGIQTEGRRRYFEFYRFTTYRCAVCGTCIRGLTINSSVERYIMVSEHYSTVRESHVCKNGHDNFENFYNAMS